MRRIDIKVRQPVEQPEVRISIDTAEPEYWDSTMFDSVPREVMLMLHQRYNRKHRAKFMELASSRLSLDNAVSNVQNALNADVGVNTIELLTDADRRSVETAYSMAVRWYVYNHVLQLVVDDATRHAVLQTLSVQQPPRNASPGTSAPNAMLARSGDVEDAVSRLSSKLDNMLGAPVSDSRTGRKKERTTKPLRPIPTAPRRKS